MGSAVNDTTREVGGAIGIAVVGTLLATGYRSAISGDRAGALRVAGLTAEQASRALGPRSWRHHRRPRGRGRATAPACCGPPTPPSATESAPAPGPWWPSPSWRRCWRGAPCPRPTVVCMRPRPPVPPAPVPAVGLIDRRSVTVAVVRRPWSVTDRTGKADRADRPPWHHGGMAASRTRTRTARTRPARLT